MLCLTFWFDFTWQLGEGLRTSPIPHGDDDEQDDFDGEEEMLDDQDIDDHDRGVLNDRILGIIDVFG